MQPRVHFLLPVAGAAAPVRLGTCVYVDSVVLAATRYTLSQNFTVSRYHWLAHDCDAIFVCALYAFTYACDHSVPVTLTWFETYRLYMPKIYHDLPVCRESRLLRFFYAREEKSRWEGKKRHVIVFSFQEKIRRKMAQGIRKWELITIKNEIVRNFIFCTLYFIHYTLKEIINPGMINSLLY